MIIGITGGIGSGKSTIAKQLRQMGYEVYDTDSEAKRLIVENAHVREQIIQLFGSDAYKDGEYQTVFVAQKVFADTDLLAKLNAIVHPAVHQDVLRRFTTPPFRGESEGGLFFIECAILYTAHLDEICDKIIAITAPEEIRLERTITRDHSDINKVRARMRAQNTEEDLIRADIIINNDGSTSILALCEKILNQLKQ
jgi:dephospho-CoA kinase